MCRWGSDTVLNLTVDKAVSHTGNQRLADVKIDSCIAEFVENLNHSGVRTVNSCCGHGKGEGRILLSSGANLILPRATEGEIIT